MCNKFNRPTFIAWFFFLGAFATTVGLGTWQVQRLAWKEGLIAQIEQAKKEAPLTAKDLVDDEAAMKEKNFWPVKLSGTWLHEIEYHLAPRYYKSQFGYHIIEPLQLADKRIVLINRGWIPAAKKDVGTRPHSIAVGHSTVLGLIRVGNERTPFSPANQKEKDIWFGRDIAQMADFYELKNVVPAMVDAIGEQKADTLPVPSDGAIRLRNDHLSYIITWYMIAGGILIIFVLSHRKK
jgi:surfeit locus 1 family protein